MVLADGRVRGLRIEGESGEIERLSVEPGRIIPGAPPALEATGDGLRLLSTPGSSSLTHPIPAASGLLGVSENGRLFAEPGEAPPVRPLPDARLVESQSGRIAVFSGPTRRYKHGVLGDGLEAKSITVLKPGREGYEIADRVRPESGGVFEGIAPLWFVSGGEELLAVTESAAGVGSRVAVYEPGGALFAAGPFIGEAMKWRHVLAAGPFAPGGEMEIAAVRTPHLSPIVEFYRLDRAAGRLKVSATLAGYTSHRIGARNLDTALAGDFDGQSGWELLLPDTSYTRLGAIRRAQNGAGMAWTLTLGGELSTNLASVTDARGRLYVAAGREDGVLRIWGREGEARDSK
ncbi:hypothetical protein [Rubrobacter xylanophilus]|uniref:hypothetical protein n=1 Tax=Rubrobacter xylanophilus TaxID=49319 RepID=UPI00117B97D5|nr:hypothetical protein [Rubrobacter xylanophilus]